MESTLPIILVLVLGFVIIILLLLRKPKQSTDATLIEWLKTMQKSMDMSTKTVNTTLAENTKIINERLDNAARVIGDVQKNIGEMSEIGRGMKDLQDFLKSPKLRGNLGEQVLKELLSQTLPKQSFHMQYSFRNGTTVDAAIKTEAGIIPIDSKFPLENFRKMNSAENEKEKKLFEKEFVSDVKKHIDAISNKYIVTDEGTIDYALMYIPSEAIYYEIVNNAILFDYASAHRVLPVSPMTFYAYLKAILMGFEGQKISKKAHEILSGLRAIQKDYEKMGDNLDTLGKHILNSQNMMSQVQTGYGKLGQKISTTNRVSHEEEKLLEN